MDEPTLKNKRRLPTKHIGWLVTGILVVALVLGVTVYAIAPLRHNVRTVVTTTQAHLTPSSHTPFPAIRASSLTTQRYKILSLARTEYDKHPVSYDNSVLTYTQGTKEAWCADFLSWIMKQAGSPYVNPNSGSWRIPGVYTMQDYYRSLGRYKEVGHYTPKPGDVAFYIGRHTFDLFSTGHVALVVKVDGNTMTTVGGNEGGKIRLDTQPITAGENSLVGFGTLD